MLTEEKITKPRKKQDDRVLKHLSFNERRKQVRIRRKISADLQAILQG